MDALVEMYEHEIEDFKAKLAAANEKIENQHKDFDRMYSKFKEAHGRADGLQEELEKALPRMTHRFECVSVLPSEMWHQNGSVSLDSCKCEIKIIKAAIKAAQEGR